MSGSSCLSESDLLSDSDQLSNQEDINTAKSIMTPNELYDFDTERKAQKLQKQKIVTFAEPVVASSSSEPLQACLSKLNSRPTNKAKTCTPSSGTNYSNITRQMTIKTKNTGNSGHVLYSTKETSSSSRLGRFYSAPVENSRTPMQTFPCQLRPEEQRIEAIIRQVGESIIDRCKSIAENKVSMDSVHELYLNFVKENQKELNEQLTRVYDELWKVTKSRQQYRDYCGKLVLVIHGLMEEILIPMLSFSKVDEKEHLEDMLEKDKAKYDTTYELVHILEEKLRNCEGVFVHESYETIEDTEDKKKRLEEYLEIVQYLKAQTASNLLSGLKKLVKILEKDNE